jgi:hypothetical protein
MDLTEVDNAKINERQVSDNIALNNRAKSSTNVFFFFALAWRNYSPRSLSYYFSKVL